MSFTQNIKENISKSSNSCRMCDIAELSAICKLCTNSQGGEIFTVTESEAVAERIKALFSRVFAKDIYCKNKNGSFRFCYDTEFFTDVVAEKLMLFGGGYEKLLKKECCKRAYLRGAFLGGGSVSDPNSRYHLEFDARYEAYAEELCGILKECGVNGKITCRKGRYIVYVKGYEQIAGVLGLIGDFTAAMDLYNVTAEKYLRNNANRRTNCEIANIDKTARAAAAQIAAIKKLERSPEFEKLPKPLREMARLRVENPLDSLSELGEKAHPPIGKSGVDHRLRRLAEIAKEI